MRITTSAIANKTHTHPITTIHPVTGRRALFVSPGYTMAIENLNKTESDAILGFLFQHMTSDSFVHRHSWRSNMLVMWDNRSVLHCAEGGYDGHLRLMHRTVIAGQRPQWTGKPPIEPNQGLIHPRPAAHLVRRPKA